MGIDRAPAEEEFVGDFLIRLAPGHVKQHFRFARGQDALPTQGQSVAKMVGYARPRRRGFGPR